MKWARTKEYGPRGRVGIKNNMVGSNTSQSMQPVVELPNPWLPPVLIFRLIAF